MAAVRAKANDTYEVSCPECGAHWIENSEAAAQRAAADHEAFHKENMS
jgi:uncharacterized Zn ribbon protein